MEAPDMDARIPPGMPIAEWQDTKTTLHLFAQIVGKVRLTMHPSLNHWWHVPFYVSGRGLTTASIPHAGGTFDMEFDLLEHQLVIRLSDGRSASVDLEGQSVSEFYGTVRAALVDLGIRMDIIARPFDPSKAKSDIPFARDTVHDTYDPEAVSRFFRMLSWVDPVFKEFRGRYLGKCSPVHFFWHSFDLAVTRFSGRAVAVSPDADPVTRDAYSHEVISAGFWPGDDQVPAPAFYCYAAPEPAGLADEAIRPATAVWNDLGSSHMAGLMYDDLEKMDSPREALLNFLQSTYEAGAKRANWPRKELERA
jgi:hypothetical protein